VTDSVCTSNWSNVESAAATLMGQYSGCSVSTNCDSLGSLDSQNYYKVETAVNCGSGKNEVERRQEIWVKE